MARHHCTGRRGNNAAETTELLLTQGANINEKDEYGRTPLTLGGVEQRG